MKTRIFELIINGETIVIESYNIVQAIMFYSQETGLILEDFDEHSDVIEIHETEWDSKTAKNCENPNKKDVLTYRELLTGQNNILAGTDFY